MASATPAAMPGPPAGLAAIAGNAQVTLSWAAPASDGGSPVSGYNVYQGTSPDGETARPVNGSLVTGTSYTVTGLTNGTTYYFRVTAVNRVGEGPPSAEAKAVPVTLPGAPARLTATPGNSRVTLAWTAPASGWRRAISGYLIYQGTSPGGETGAPVNGSLVTGTSYTVTGLTNGTTYYFKVFAVNAAGQSLRRPRRRPRCRPSHADSAPATASDLSPGVRRTDRADRDRGRHPGPPVVERARVGWRFAGHQLQGLCRHRPRTCQGEPRVGSINRHRRHRDRSA